MELGISSAQVGTWILLICVSALAYYAWMLFAAFCLKPLRAKRLLEAQGLKGMPYRFFVGNAQEFVELTKRASSIPMPEISHDIAPRILPHYFLWTQKLGNPFFFWFGPQPSIFVAKPELVREIFLNKFGHYGPPKRRPDLNDLIGNGLGFLDGEKWARHRRIVSPAFFMEKLKAMTPTMAACTVSMLNDWTTQVEKEVSGRKEIDVQGDFRNLTGDIIARTAFGSSYAEGKQVFQIQHEQQILFEKAIFKVYIPGSRFIPTKTNRYRRKLDTQMQKLLRQLIHSRMDAIKQGGLESYGNDLLGLMIAANMKESQGNQKKLSMDTGEMVDECKQFFFAGHETTSILLTWTMLLLGTSMEWQERAREEVLKVCGREAPTSQSLPNLKIVAMILNEVLRLYPPVVLLTRNVSQNVKLGEEFVVPEGATLFSPIISIQHDPEFWGPDANDFNPNRFVEGIANATNGLATFMPFGIGPRVCVGQNFALLEAKVALALILQRFAFHVSPSYIHAPHTILTLQPQFGMQIIFEKCF